MRIIILVCAVLVASCNRGPKSFSFNYEDSGTAFIRCDMEKNDCPNMSLSDENINRLSTLLGRELGDVSNYYSVNLTETDLKLLSSIRFCGNYETTGQFYVWLLTDKDNFYEFSIIDNSSTHYEKNVTAIQSPLLGGIGFPCDESDEGLLETAVKTLVPR